MQQKPSFYSTELLTGLGMIIVGLAVHAAGIHSTMTEAIAPFGIGVILSDVLPRAAKSAQQRVRVRIRRDDE